MADNEVQIRVITVTDLAQLEELDALIEEIQDKAEIDGTVEVDDTSVTEATGDAEELEDELNTIDNTVVSPEVDSSGLDDLKSSAEDASSSLDSIATAAVGVGATAGIEQMVSTADRINTSWNQLELTIAIRDIYELVTTLNETTHVIMTIRR